MSEWNEHKAMLAALEHGTATPGQQRAARAYIDDMRARRAQDRDRLKALGNAVMPMITEILGRALIDDTEKP